MGTPCVEVWTSKSDLLPWNLANTLVQLKLSFSLVIIPWENFALKWTLLACTLSSSSELSAGDIDDRFDFSVEIGETTVIKRQPA